MDRWLAQIGDNPSLPEKELVSKLWDGKEKKPKTAAPKLNIVGKKIAISCDTKGASIGYKTNPKDISWQIYTKPIILNPNQTLLVKSHRIGYDSSEIVTVKPPN